MQKRSGDEKQFHVRMLAVFCPVEFPNPAVIFGTFSTLDQTRIQPQAHIADLLLTEPSLVPLTRSRFSRESYASSRPRAQRHPD